MREKFIAFHPQLTIISFSIQKEQKEKVSSFWTSVDNIMTSFSWVFETQNTKFVNS